MGTPTTDVGPGIGAFIAFFALALVLWLLMRNMNGRMRRMAYTERERVARLEAREAELEARRTPGASDDATGEATGEATGDGQGVPAEPAPPGAPDDQADDAAPERHQP